MSIPKDMTDHEIENIILLLQKIFRSLINTVEIIIV